MKITISDLLPKQLNSFIKKYNFIIIFTILIILFLYLYFKPTPTGADENWSLLEKLGIWKKYKTPEKKIIIHKKYETECKNILQKIFNKQFIQIRPDFLKWKYNKNLELDMFNQELNLALEYQGRQHYNYIPFFHKSINDFYEQVERDNYKKNICEQIGINLITVPYTIKFENLEKYIKQELKKYNYL